MIGMNVMYKAPALPLNFAVAPVLFFCKFIQIGG